MRILSVLCALLLSHSVGAQNFPTRNPSADSLPGMDQPFLNQEELLKEQQLQKAKEDRQAALKQKLERKNMLREESARRSQALPSREAFEKIPGQRDGAESLQGLSRPLESRKHLENEMRTNFEAVLTDEELPTDPNVIHRSVHGRQQQSRPFQEESFLVESRSPVEQVFFGNFPGEISRDLKQFGYDLFNKAPEEFAPLEDVPVSNDYVVGPGDSFTINVWGSNNFTHSVTVRRDGTIFIPKIGNIKVWGDTYSEMNKKIEKRLSSFFSGIKVGITFDTIRNIDVFVVGEVTRPGSYSVPATSAAINVLFHAGGPSKRGSLRNIQVVRNNKTIATVDLYDFLIKGKSVGPKLQSQDVLLVPVVGKVAAVAGNVKRPAIYEIHDKTTLVDLLEMAGGLTFTGEAGRLELQRVNQNKERVTKDFQIPANLQTATAEDLKASELSASAEDGDLVKVFPVQSQIRKTVFLRGYVKRPGAYEFRDGMTLKSLIPSFDSLLPEPYTDFVQIIRTVPPKDERQSLFADLRAAVSGDKSQDIKLQERDEIIVFSKTELNLREKVSITGRVNKPGEYFYFDGMKLRDLIFMAGNITQDAYKANAEIARYRVDQDRLVADRLQVNLAETLKGNPTYNPTLQAKDRVFIFGLSNWESQNFVALTGEVQFPGTYPFLPGEKLSQVLERAGGFTDKAFLNGAIFTRKSVRELQAQTLKQQIAQLEEAILQETINPNESISAQDKQGLQEATIARRAMLRNLQEAEVTGRMVIQLADLKKFRGSKFDIPLEAGDSLAIPPTPSVVTVMGEVYNPTSIVHLAGKTVSYYLDMAGGPTVNADTDSIFIVKADGSVISRRQRRGFLLRNFYQTKVETGDAILVPKDISQFSWLATTKDITEILFKIASTTGITITALK
jgi:protein involved in polysaccharide export with SLBB domain